MSITITDSSDGFTELLQALNFLSTHEIEIGIFEGPMKSGGDLTVYGKAIINEYGAEITVTDKMRAYLHRQGIHLKKDTDKIVIPERSFIRGSYDSNKREIESSIDDMLGDIYEGKLTAEEFFNILGENSVRLIRSYIQAGISPANSPVTLANKMGSTPLIDTTELIKNLEWRIVQS